MTDTPEQRAAAQGWASKLQYAEVELELYKEALRDVLDSLGALSNPDELSGRGMSAERIEQITALANKDN